MNVEPWYLGPWYPKNQWSVFQSLGLIYITLRIRPQFRNGPKIPCKAICLHAVVAILCSRLIAQTPHADWVAGEAAYINPSSRVAIVVNSELQAEIQNNLAIYLKNLVNEGWEPILRSWDLGKNPEPAQLRQFLQSLYTQPKSLQGAVFIGHLPVQVQISKDMFGNEKKHITEMYYQDLEGEYTLGYDTNIPNSLSIKTAKIWTSRIFALSVADILGATEAELVNRYLEKNNAYRTGQVHFDRTVTYYDSPSAFPNIKFPQSEVFSQHLQGSGFKYVNKSELTIPTVDYFLSSLMSSGSEITIWLRHGDEQGIQVGYTAIEEQNRLTPLLFKQIGRVHAPFLFPISCCIGNYLQSGYFGGILAFSNTSYVLAQFSGTEPFDTFSQMSIPRHVSYLVQGASIGACFLKKQGFTLRGIYYPPYTEDIDYEEYEKYPKNMHRLASSLFPLRDGEYILGDGTLKVYPPAIQTPAVIPAIEFLIHHGLFTKYDFIKAVNRCKLEGYFKTGTAWLKQSIELLELIQ